MIGLDTVGRRSSSSSTRACGVWAGRARIIKAIADCGLRIADCGDITQLRMSTRGIGSNGFALLVAARRRAKVTLAVLGTVAFAQSAVGQGSSLPTGDGETVGQRSSLPSAAPAAEGEVMNGWRVFHDKRCVDCHAIWDQGGRFGPDLGRAGSGRLSEGRLAGVMWNHIPKMQGWMKQIGHAPEAVNNEEMADLFALISFVRQLDELGDPVLGEAVLRSKGCSECHSTDASGGTVGPDLAKWGRYANPTVWAQLMWEHAPVMEIAMMRSGMSWPKLEGSDLVHIVAYVRSAGTSGDKIYLHPGSTDRGRRLFLQKKCDACHPGTGPDLSTADLPVSVGALASRMWNHSPEMTRQMQQQEVDRQPITPQELVDILAYVLALGAQDRGGDYARGQRVFSRKGCGQCHDTEEIAEAAGPPIGQLRGHSSPVAMAAAMWNHGETMLQRMTEAGLAWPVFNEGEMVDLLAYLQGLETKGGRGEK